MTPTGSQRSDEHTEKCPKCGGIITLRGTFPCGGPEAWQCETCGHFEARERRSCVVNITVML